MRSRRFLILLFVSIVALNVNAQLKFSAVADPAQLGPGETFELKFIVENANDLEKILPPSLNNFSIVSGPSREEGMSMINGNVKKYVAVTYVIKANSVGTFIIPSAIARADGHELKSNPVSVKIAKAYANASPRAGNTFASPFNFPDPFEDAPQPQRFSDNVIRKGENPIDKIKNNIFVRLETDKTSCFVGEPIVASYKLYSRLPCESNITKNPSFTGFSVVDLQQQDNITSHIEKLNGREFNVITIRKVQLYPLQPGNVELESAEIENQVHFVKAEYLDRRQNAFDDLFPDIAVNNVPPEGIESQKVTLASKPLNILVKPLPDAKPASFRGAVGNFEISASVAQNGFSTDDAGKLMVVISGNGNLQMVTPPEIAWPSGIEGFDAKSTDDIYKTTVPVSGRKIMEYPFTVSKAGSYTIPSISYSFFDPKTASYKTVSSKPVTFTVTQGTGKPKVIDTSVYAKNEPSTLTKFFSNRLRVVSVVAALIILGLLIWLKRDKKNEQITKAEIEAKKLEEESATLIIENQKNPLADAEESLFANNGSAFYNQLNHSFKNYLSNKLGIAIEELNKKSINEKMDARSIPLHTSLQVNALMDEIEWQLFTPSADSEKMQEMYERATALVQEINSRLIS